MVGEAGLVGREDEVGLVGRALADQTRLPLTILLEGEAGIGKTTIWRAAVKEARASGYRVLSCAGALSESQLSLSAFRDLLEGAYDEVAGQLTAPQRRAMAVALLREEPGDSPPDHGAIAAAFLATFQALARRGPTLIAVDDIQWLDPMSATLLAYARRRFATDRIAVLLARRLEADEALPLGLDPDDDRLEIVRIGALSIGAIGSILQRRLNTTYPRSTLVRLHDVSGGNPLFALELAFALGQSARSLRPGAPLPVPDTLRKLLRARIKALPRETTDILIVASALPRPSLDLIGRVLERDPLDMLDAAIDAQVADVDGDLLRFGHPLMAAAVYDLASAQRLRETHQRLAALVEDREERAMHVALGTDEASAEVADAVEEGARLAFARGSPAAAAVLAAHARRLTPTEAVDDLRRRSLAEVEYHFEAGDTSRAFALLDLVIDETPSGPARARLLSRRARLGFVAEAIGESVRLLELALEEVGEDLALRGEIEEGLAWGLLLVRRDLAGAWRHARSATRISRKLDDRAALAEGLAADAMTAFMLGRAWQTTMREAVLLEGEMVDLRVLRLPSFAYGWCLTCADELDQARTIFDELLGRAAQQGDESSVPSILNRLAYVEWIAGRWDVAERLAADGYTRATESRQLLIQASTLGKGAIVAACRGRFAEAREAALQALALADATGFEPTRPGPSLAGGGESPIWAMGFIALSLGQPDEAHRYLGPLTDALLASGIEEPGEMRWLADEIEALVMLGRRDQAGALIDRLEAWGRRLDRPSARAAAARCRGLLHASQDESDRALAALREAVAWGERRLLPFEHARSLLALGTQERRARERKAARETLDRARGIFQELGASPWVDRATAELGRIGGRAPSGDGLTPTERQVAALVAGGRTNREAADSLVISVHTVEAALTQVYGKLGIRSRTELARRFAELEDPNV